ncbi:MAG: choice-of-anchor Q domain-containing protein [Chloroflexota bacterium]
MAPSGHDVTLCGRLANNGGDTLTHALLDGSPAA